MTQEWKEPAAGEDVQMPLGTGGDSAPVEDYTPQRPRMNTSTMALVGAFLAGLVVLYALALQNKPRAASADDNLRRQETNTTIENWLKNKESQKGVRQLGQGLLERLQGFFTPQASMEDLKSNPFERSEVKRVVINLEPTPLGTQPAPIIIEEMPELKEVAKEYAGLKLQMVMMGNPPAAMINSNMARVGTQFKYLKITEIQADRVLLTYESKNGQKRVFALTVGGKDSEEGAFGGSRPK
jgi:hypothetical protein